jgi:hypothetical protein
VLHNLVEGYIGTDAGYLKNFSYSIHDTFYHITAALMLMCMLIERADFCISRRFQWRVAGAAWRWCYQDAGDGMEPSGLRGAGLTVKSAVRITVSLVSRSRAVTSMV